MGIRLIGLERFNRRLERVEQVTNEVVREELTEFGAKVQIEAKTNHKFVSRSGNLKRSIKRIYSFSRAHQRHKLRLYLDGRLTTIRSGSHSGKSYGAYQHNGTRYITADPFLKRAYDRHLPKLKRALRNVPRKVRRRI